MKVVIVGAGIGGLSAAIALGRQGHRVVLYESAPMLAEVGAGVQLGPNAVRLWFDWGLGPDLLEKALNPEELFIHNWKDGRVLGHCKIAGEWEKRFAAPYIVIHRAELHSILYRHALRHGAEVKVNSRVVEYDFESPAITLASGENICADMVIAADGINSSARKLFLGNEDPGPASVGWAAFRMMTDVNKIQEDPEISWIVSRSKLHLWIGPSHSVMTYMVLGSKVLNVVLSHPDDIDTSGWSGDQIAQEIRKQFEDWNPTVKTLISLMRPNPANWPVDAVSPRRWTSESGRFVLMGDAAHSMAFYLSSGVSMAVEDAAALAVCVAYVDRLPLSRSMKIFEHHRMERALAVAEASLQAGNILHRPDGPEQEARDALLKPDKSGETTADNLCGLSDPRTREWIYSYDAEKAMRRLLDGVI